MGDILSQEEIDDLLTPAHEAFAAELAGHGIDAANQEAFFRQVDAAILESKSAAELRRMITAAAEPLARELSEKGVAEPIRNKLLDERLENLVFRRRFELVKKLGPETRIVTDYDFKHPARVNKNQLRTLENLHDNFARLLRSTLSGAMRSVVEVDTAYVDQTTYAEFINSLSNPACSYQFTFGPANSQAIMDVATPLVFGFVDRVLGGKGSSQGVGERQMTAIEIGITAQIVRRMISDLEATWEPILDVDLREVELETNPEFMQITAPSEIVILLAFEVNSTNASGLVSVCYPFFTLEPILPLLGQRTYIRTNQPGREKVVRENRARLGPVSVPLAVELGRTELTLGEAERVQVGDIICAKNRVEDPCVVFAGDAAKYYARPFANETGAVRLQVVGKVPTELESSYNVLPPDRDH